MKPLNNWRVVFLALAFPGSLHAVDLSGTVREIPREYYATITLDSEVTPNVGDPVEIFSTVPGSDGSEAEISVGTGKVTAIQANSVEVKIDEATGTVSKGQLARIKSEKPQMPEATATPSASPEVAVVASPSLSSEETRENPLVGRWSGRLPAGQQGTLVFKADGTAILPIPVGEGMAMTGKYKVNYTGNLPRFAITNFEFLPPPNLTDEELKQFQQESASDPESKDILEAIWMGEIIDASHIRLQKFTKAETVARPQLKPDAGVLTKLAPGEVTTAPGSTPAPIAAVTAAAAVPAAPPVGEVPEEIPPRSLAKTLPPLVPLPTVAPKGATPPPAARQSGPRPPPPNSGSAEWTDLTNAPQKMIGTWQIGSHRTRFFANGTFVNTPADANTLPRGNWQVQGDRLVQYFPGNRTVTHQILSLSGKTLVIKSPDGQTYRLTKRK